MSITGYTQQRIGGITTVAVTSDLVGTIYYHWFVDGQHVASGTAAEHTFFLSAGDRSVVEVVDTLDAAADPLALAPAGWPARRTLWWCRALDGDLAIAKYRIDQSRAGGTWTALGTLFAEPDRWDYSFVTDRLDDLTQYAWRIVPIDTAGNDGAALYLPAETIVRTPDPPRFTITLDEPTAKVLVESF